MKVFQKTNYSILNASYGKVVSNEMLKSDLFFIFQIQIIVAIFINLVRVDVQGA